MSEERIFPNIYYRTGICILVVLLAFSLATLGRVPEIPAADDGGYAAAADQFWKTGHPGVPGYRNVLGLNRDVFAFGRTAAAFQGVFMHIFGISLFTALLPSFLLGGGVLMVTYGLGNLLWGSECGLLAVIILAGSGIFFMASHMARPDMLLALCLVTALYMCASASPHKWSWRYVAAGTIMGLSGDVHLNGFFLAPVPLLFWFALKEEKNRLRIMVTATYLGPLLLGAIFWLAIRYWPDSGAFDRQFAVFGGKTHGIRIVNLGPLAAFWSEVNRYLSWFWAAKFHRHLLEGLAVMGCGAWMGLWGGRKERALVVVWLAIFVIAVCLWANPYTWYLIYVWPLFALWLARTFFAASVSIGRPFAVTAISVLLISYMINLTLWAGKAFSGPSYNEIATNVRSIVPKNASVVAGGEWWFALHDRDFTDDMHVRFFRLATENGCASCGWEEAWKRLGWRYVVSYGDLQLMFDAEAPVEKAMELLPRYRKTDILKTRTFAIQNGRAIQRIQTASTPILILALGKER